MQSQRRLHLHHACQRCISHTVKQDLRQLHSLEQRMPHAGRDRPSPKEIPPPEDEHLRRAINSLAPYVARLGPSSEKLVTVQLKSKPGYSFLGGGLGEESLLHPCNYSVQPHIPLSAFFMRVLIGCAYIHSPHRPHEHAQRLFPKQQHNMQGTLFSVYHSTQHGHASRS